MKPGDRVRLTAPIHDDYPPPGLSQGLEGTVVWVGDRQASVEWDNGRTLNLLLDVDEGKYEVVVSA